MKPKCRVCLHEHWNSEPHVFKGEVPKPSELCRFAPNKSAPNHASSSAPNTERKVARKVAAKVAGGKKAAPVADKGRDGGEAAGLGDEHRGEVAAVREAPVGVRSAAWKKANPEKYRAYQRDLMRARRAAAKAAKVSG